ncbi:peptidoglycan-binding protein [Streptomyces sp. NPDC047315]|uniref:peptidoglycan-binding protein n=1 Tax=Streptomyces sp. NPDC047315 TaxID=3155142 RepID=UPI0033C0D147
MTAPVFQEYEPAPDCDCPGCVERRRVLAAGGHPAAHGCRRALVLVTAAGVVLSGGGASAAGAVEAQAAPGLRPERAPEAAARGAGDRANEQGGPGALHGRPLPGPSGTPAVPEVRKTTRTEIIKRAKTWVSAKVPYSMSKYWKDGYRQDCSGYVSMAWGLATNEWTGSLAKFATKISRSDLQPGDILLFHNPANPTKGSHVTIFGGWTDHTRTHYVAYEQTKPATRKQSTPMAYWNNSGKYVAYRFKGLTGQVTTGPTTADAFPGAQYFGPGKSNKHITRLGQMLVKRGGKKFYATGPGPRWGEADRKATQAFQRAQGWRGSAADGIPGAKTWNLLVTGKGKNIPATDAAPAPASGAAVVPPYPGPGAFRPGQSGPHVTRLGQQLVKRGFGRHYATGPGPVWGEADRRNVEAFQLAQGWRGAAADGYPGPDTWRRLFAG